VVHTFCGNLNHLDTSQRGRGLTAPGTAANAAASRAVRSFCGGDRHRDPSRWQPQASAPSGV